MIESSTGLEISSVNCGYTGEEVPVVADGNFVQVEYGQQIPDEVVDQLNCPRSPGFDPNKALGCIPCGEAVITRYEPSVTSLGAPDSLRVRPMAVSQ
jgi:hypothetical protein